VLQKDTLCTLSVPLGGVAAALLVFFNYVAFMLSVPIIIKKMPLWFLPFNDIFIYFLNFEFCVAMHFMAI